MPSAKLARVKRVVVVRSRFHVDAFDSLPRQPLRSAAKATTHQLHHQPINPRHTPYNPPTTEQTPTTLTSLTMPPFADIEEIDDDDVPELEDADDE